MKRIAAILALLGTLCGCAVAPPSPAANSHAFSFVTNAEGKVFRVNSVTGETWLVVGGELKRAPQAAATPLEVGKKYFIEKNRSMIYLGDGKFTEPIADYSSIWN